MLGIRRSKNELSFSVSDRSKRSQACQEKQVAKQRVQYRTYGTMSGDTDTLCEVPASSLDLESLELDKSHVFFQLLGEGTRLSYKRVVRLLMQRDLFRVGKVAGTSIFSVVYFDGKLGL